MPTSARIVPQGIGGRMPIHCTALVQFCLHVPSSLLESKITRNVAFIGIHCVCCGYVRKARIIMVISTEKVWSSSVWHKMVSSPLREKKTLHDYATNTTQDRVIIRDHENSVLLLNGETRESLRISLRAREEVCYHTEHGTAFL